MTATIASGEHRFARKEDMISLITTPAVRTSGSRRILTRTGSGFLSVIALLVLPMVGGCYHQMALQPKLTSLDTGTQSVAIFTLVVKNDFKPQYGSTPFWITVHSDRTGSTKFLLSGDWEGNGDWRTVINWTGTSEFPVSMGLEPGKYSVGEVLGSGRIVPLLLRHFNFPLKTEFELPPGSVVYLGHIVMTNRERKQGEERSGDVVPLVDQAVSGYSGGTMDITITDRSAEDIPKFIEKYPCLKGMTIKTAIMTKK